MHRLLLNPQSLFLQSQHGEPGAVNDDYFGLKVMVNGHTMALHCQDAASPGALATLYRILVHLEETKGEKGTHEGHGFSRAVNHSDIHGFSH